MSINNQDSETLFQLGLQYENIKGEDNKVEFYYKLAIEKESSDAMNRYGLFLIQRKKNYIEGKKYFNMALKLKNSNAMYNLGLYYELIETNTKKSKKYYLMASKYNDFDAMYKLGKYYETDEDYDNAIKYYYNSYKYGGESSRDKLAILVRTEIKNIVDGEETIKKKRKIKKKLKCIICMGHEKIIVSTKCYINHRTHDHLYCEDCFKMWYSNHEYSCLMCNKLLIPSNFLLYC